MENENYQMTKNDLENNQQQQEELNILNKPNNTIYINNLNEKVGIEILKKKLQLVFQNYGEILDIIAKKNVKMKGQAFVIFKSVDSAISAQEEQNDHIIFNKPMKINFSKIKSDIISKKDGTYQKREKQKMTIVQEFNLKLQQRNKVFGNKAEQGAQDKAKGVSKKQVISQLRYYSYYNNRTITYKQIISFIVKICLKMLNSKIQNNFFKNIRVLCNFNLFFELLQIQSEVRFFPKKGIAFVEYESELFAGFALVGLEGFQLTPSYKLQVNYANK